ncbi:hypothetical protein EI94DRAFT_1794790 [Lactarius quietus]|nr:hypothetical protein EI94DRAFT_1794790 [Lactarius quietus]
MRPPTRSTRSVRRRQPSKKVSPNAQGSPHTPSLPVSFLLEVNPQPIESIADSNIEVGTSESTPIAGCLPSESWTPTTFVYENQKLASHDTPGATVTPTGKLPRSRHRMTSDKLETLDAFFRRNTHPSRKEKEAICKDLDMDLKTVTIWFQNKRQTVARSRKQSESFKFSSESPVPTAAMDLLASTSATMTPLTTETATRRDSGSGGSSARCLSRHNLDPPASQLLYASSCAPYPSAVDLQPCIPRSGPTTAQDSNVFGSGFQPREMSTAVVRVSSPSSSPEGPESRQPRNHHWPIHPENLWKYIPSSPVQQEQPVPTSSPDVSPDIGVVGGSAGTPLRRRPRTLEWACARSAKRRRANLDDHCEDGATDAGCNAEERSAICHSPCCISKARVPPECYGNYPLDVVRGAVLLLGLKDAAHGLGV